MLGRIIYLLIVFTISFAALGQEVNTKHQTVFYPEGDSVFQFEILKEQKNTRLQPAKTYYTYKNFQLLATSGKATGYLLDGEYSLTDYHSDELMEQGTFKRGLKHGKWVTWYEGGRIKRIESWRNGLQHGSFQMYSENGAVLTQGKMKAGKLVQKKKKDKIGNKKIWDPFKKLFEKDGQKEKKVKTKSPKKTKEAENEKKDTKGQGKEDQVEQNIQ